MSNDVVTSQLPPGFDPFNQPVMLYLPDGTPFNITMGDVDFYRAYGIRTSINFATQIGACVVLLVILLILSRREKRRASVFILNSICLVVNIIRTILQCCFFTGPFYNPYAYFSGDFSRVTSVDTGVSVAADVLTLILVIFIMASLILQVQVVCVTTLPVQRFWILFASSTVALVAISFRFAETVINIEAIVTLQAFYDWNWLVTAQTVTQAIAIWFFSIIFLAKLALALLQRRKLGMRQFGAMQIIFIMGCQTLIIPAIFTVLQFVDGVPELGTQSLTMVCVFLPISAIWAGTLIDERNMGARGPDAHHRLLDSPVRKNVTSTSGQSDTLHLGSIGDNSTKIGHSPTSSPTKGFWQNKEGYEGDIHVQNAWSVSEGSQDTRG